MQLWAPPIWAVGPPGWPQHAIDTWARPPKGQLEHLIELLETHGPALLELSGLKAKAPKGPAGSIMGMPLLGPTTKNGGGLLVLSGHGMPHGRHVGQWESLCSSCLHHAAMHNHHQHVCRPFSTCTVGCNAPCGSTLCKYCMKMMHDVHA